MKQSKFLIVIILFIWSAGCDQYLPGLTGGRTVPDARVLIEFAEPVTLTELYPSFVQVAFEGGFAHLLGYTGSPALEHVISESGPFSFIVWTEEPNQNTLLIRRAAFNIRYNKENDLYVETKAITSIDFVLGKADTKGFTQEEWEEFFKFYREILPRVFNDEGVQFSISSHPALFTDKELLLEIQASTDFEIPEKYLAAQ